MPTETAYDMTLAPTSTPNFYTPVLIPIVPTSGGFGGGFTTSVFDSDVFAQNGCLSGCFDSPEGAAAFNMLQVDFGSAVSSVIVQQGAQSDNPAIVLAFNSAGALVSSCEGDGTPPFSACYSVLPTTGSSEFNPGIAQFVVTGAGITTLEIGGLSDTVENVLSVQVSGASSLALAVIAALALLLVPAAGKGSVRPRLQLGASVRPLNSSVTDV
jgi:hypothetical protein